MFSLSDAIKVRLCRYILQRYLGQFLQEKLSLDQLSVELSSSSGSAEVTDVTLDVQGLNELSENDHWPFLFVDGYIGSVKVEVPWRAVLHENSHVVVKGLMLTIQPKSWIEDLSVIESMYSSMMSSKQMAEEIFKQEEPQPEVPRPHFMQGLETTIDSIFNRVVVTFEDTTLRVEHLMHNNHQEENHFWTALEIQIARFEYRDALAYSDKKILIEEQGCQSTKNATLTDIKLLVDRFNTAQRNEINPDKKCGALCAKSPEINSNPIMFAFLKGNQELEIKIEPGDGDTPPKFGYNLSLSELPIFIEPRQLMMLSSLLSSFLGATNNNENIQESPCKALSKEDFALMDHSLQKILEPSNSNRFGIMAESTYGGLGGLQTWAGEQDDQVQYYPMCNSTDDAMTSLHLSSTSNMTVQTRFELHIGIVLMIILEEEEKNSDDSHQKSSHFFKEIVDVPLSHIVKVATEGFLPYKHFRVGLYPVNLTGVTKSSSNQRAIEGKMTIANAEVVRSEKQWIESILTSTFDSRSDKGNAMPFMRLKGLLMHTNSVNASTPDVARINCAFGAINMKYDRLLESRFIEMFGTPPGSNKQSNKARFNNYSPKCYDINLDVTCSKLSCALRFQALEVATTEKKLRPDKLIVTLEKITMTSEISNLAQHNHKISFDSGHVDYVAEDGADAVQLARVFSDANYDDDENRGKATVNITVSSSESTLLAHMTDSMHMSSMRSMTDDARAIYKTFQEPGPFQGKSIVYNNEKDNYDRVVFPADKKKMKSFFEDCSSKSKVNVDISLPIVFVEFANRELFEIIYNRVLTDLFYTPTFDCQQFRHDDGAKEENVKFKFVNDLDQSDQTTFYSTSDDDDTLYFHKPIKQNLLALSMTVREGCLVLGHGHTEPGEYYSFRMNPKEVKFYLVSNYQGDPNESFVFLHARDAFLYHEPCNEQPRPTHAELTKDMMIPSPGSLLLLDRINKRTFGKYRPDDASFEMLSLAVEIRAEPTAKLKKVKLAINIADTCWHYTMSPPKHFWITQLMELFTVRDFPVAGHIPSSVITELHFNLEKSIIDYRPLYLPYNALMSFENFSLSGNITTKSKKTTLRVILEDTSLFLSKSGEKQKPALIDRDYVCVINADLLDLCCIWSAPINVNGNRYQKMNFSVSNDIITISTCSDSLFALMSLLTYLGEERDLPKTKERSPKPNPLASSVHELDEDCLSTMIHQTPEQLQAPSILNEMMESAIYESFSSHSGSSNSLSSSVPGIEAIEAYPPDITKLGSNPNDDDFCVLHEQLGSGITERRGQETIRVLNGESIVLQDNFLKIPSGKTDQLQAPEGYPEAMQCFTLKEMSIKWCFYGGNDFGSGPSRGNLIRSLGGAGRDMQMSMELMLSKIRFRHEIYAPDEQKTSRQCLLIKDIIIRDKLRSSKIDKFLYGYSNDSRPRQANANMVMLKVTHIGPNNECAVLLSVSPLRLNIDQEALVFLEIFFTSLSENVGQMSSPSQSEAAGPSFSVSTNTEAPQQIYIRSFEFKPEILIRIDYNARQIDYNRGAAGVVLGCTQIRDMEVRLKKVVMRKGVLGFHRLGQVVFEEWKADILRHQIPNVIGGVGPMRSFVQLFCGIRDLFWLPVEQYRKDGQVVRGIQRGTQSFCSNAAIAALELTGKAVGTIQHAAELAYNLLSPATSIPISGRISDQPQDIREGVHNAYRLMANGINDTARNLAQAAATDTKSRGVTGAVGEVLRNIPPAVVRPIIDVTAATTNVINGVKYQLAPDNRQEDLEKWKKTTNNSSKPV